MTMRRLLLPATILLLSSPAGADAQAPRVRLTDVAKDAARIEVVLETPAAVEVEYGEELFAWDGRAESLEPALRHELRLGKLLPERQYFYRVLVDDADSGEVLTFRSGRSWIARRAVLFATADTPAGADGEAALAERLFGEQGDAIVALGGDGGDPEAFRRLHGRAMSDRLVVESGGTGDVDALRVAAVSDLALASVGANPLLLPDGSPAPAAAWLATALNEVEGACWHVVASAGPGPGSADDVAALLAWASRADVHVVLTRAQAPRLERSGDALWVGLPDPPAAGERAVARVESAAGALVVTLEDASGGELDASRLSRACPIPEALLASIGAEYEDDELGGGASSAVEGGAEDCDY
jgi:hypothetical protein